MVEHPSLSLGFGIWTASFGVTLWASQAEWLLLICFTTGILPEGVWKTGLYQPIRCRATHNRLWNPPLLRYQRYVQPLECDFKSPCLRTLSVKTISLIQFMWNVMFPQCLVIKYPVVMPSVTLVNHLNWLISSRSFRQESSTLFQLWSTW